MSHLHLLANLCLLLSLLLSEGDGLKIVNLDVPMSVPNTTDTPVILDCDYSLELGSDDGLVIKWFLNDVPNPVYQWIRGRKPQDLGLLKGRLDLEYAASTDAKKAYRAMKILEPTVELSGLYTCFVSTFDDEARESKRMTIYTPAKTFEFSQEEDEESGQVSFRCIAVGLYPEPVFNITSSEKTKSFLAEVDMMTKDGLFDAEAKLTVDKKDLTTKTTFECVLTIPDTDYVLKKKITIPSGLRPTPNPQNYRTTLRPSYPENFVTAPEHYDPDIFFIRQEYGDPSSSRSLKATFSLLFILIFLAVRL